LNELERTGVHDGELLTGHAANHLYEVNKIANRVDGGLLVNRFASSYFSRHFTCLRRQDMLFVIAISGTALTIIGSDLLPMKPVHIALSCITFLVILLGMNSERRLTSYMGS